jgi:hypothetical protein
VNTLPRYASIIALNLALALTMSALAPGEPALSDREAYEFVGNHPLAPKCGWSIYCYRPLVPAMVFRLPFDLDTNWRVAQVTLNAAAGTVLSVAAASLSPTLLVAALAGVIAQTSYGFTFTAYDPYAADPLVFLVTALLLWCWIHDRWRVAVALGVAGVFAKETVALVAGALAIAAMIERGPRWRAWLMPAAASAVTLGAFHLATRIWLDWDISQNPAAQWRHGFWLGLWWRTNPFLERKIYMLFATFGFAWVFAVLGWRMAPPRWRVLAPALIMPMLILIVIQTPDRAFGNVFFVVAPLAALFASRTPVMGSTAIVLNALITAKAGTSSVWLPSARWVLLPAAVAAILVMVAARRTPRAS